VLGNVLVGKAGRLPCTGLPELYSVPPALYREELQAKQKKASLPEFVGFNRLNTAPELAKNLPRGDQRRIGDWYGRWHLILTLLLPTAG